MLDTDSLSHFMWGSQLVSTGSVSITEGGEYADPSIYYPNTIPKPFPLAVAAAAALLDGPMLLAVFGLLSGILCLASCAALLRDIGGGSGYRVWMGTMVLGLHPSFVVLTQRGNPLILMLALLFLMRGGASGGSGLFIMPSLIRPEGLVYSAYALVPKKLKGMLLLAASAGIWLALNRWMAGSYTWSADEVRFIVEKMAYPTPDLLSFWPHFLLRAMLVMGPVLALTMAADIWRWPYLVPASIHAALLWLSLAGGSLVLPRYMDAIFLLAIPWAINGLCDLLPRRPRLRGIVVAVAVLPTMILWTRAIPSWNLERSLRSELERIGEQGWQGRIAANELLIPRIAVAAGIDDPREHFAALDRAAADGVDLERLGVSRVLIVDHPLYLPDHTGDYIRDWGISCDTLLEER